MSKSTREQLIERGIRLTWESLESHLLYTHKKLTPQEIKQGETHKFHKGCVRDYAETLLIFSELY